jgi:hypothetical protein
MAKTYPTELADVHDGTEQKLASGTKREAHQLSDRNHFDCSTVASETTDTLSLGFIHEGDVVKSFDIISDTNMSAASIAIGTASDPDKYLAAATLPNAGVATRFVPHAADGFENTPTEREELIVTISGAEIPTGDLVIYTNYTRR